MIKNIPNFITCLNLWFGCFGLLLLIQGDPAGAAYCIWAAAVCDFFDGFAARAVKAESPMGKELDSLADAVSFGVLPAFIWFYYILQSFQPGASFTTLPAGLYIPYIAFFMAICSAWRLAKFNIDTRQTDHFRSTHTRQCTGMVGDPLYFFRFFISLGARMDQLPCFRHCFRYGHEYFIGR
jgi:CDP-diacylglycerol---serine O-phosphatidyltransferase